MIVLGVAVEPAQLGRLGCEPYLERLAGLGAGAIEAQLSAEMRSDEIARGGERSAGAGGRGVAVISGGRGRESPRAGRELLRRAGAFSAGGPATIIVHGCAGPRPDPALAERTILHLRRLAD